MRVLASIDSSSGSSIAPLQTGRVRGYDEGVQSSPRSPGLRAGLFILKTDCNEADYFVLRGRPPLRFFRMAAIWAKYSGPRSAVFDPPFAPTAAAPAFNGSAKRLARSFDSASAAFRDSRADAMDGCSGTSASERSAWLIRLRSDFRSRRADGLALPSR